MLGTIEVSWSGVINTVIEDLIGLLVVAAVGLAARWAWKYVSLGRQAIRRKNFIEICKRIRSDEYFASRQRVGMVQAMLICSYAIIALQLYSLGDRWVVMSLAMVVVEYVVIAVAIKEQWYHRKALPYRMQIERRRKSPARQMQGRKS